MWGRGRERDGEMERERERERERDSFKLTYDQRPEEREVVQK
jgi:hypothetical protein